MKTLYLHIGIHKTGTTSIQRFFTEHAKAFEDVLHYPQAGNNGISHGALSNALKSGKWEESYRAMLEKMGAVKESHYTEISHADKRALLDNLRDEINGSKSNSILLSSEGFYEWISPEELKRAFDWFAGEIKVVVYLRRQDDWLMSVYNQMVKDEKMRYFGAANKIPQLSLINFHDYLEELSACFGQQSLIVRLWYPGVDVIHDFLANVLRLDSRFVSKFAGKSVRENVSVPAQLIPLLRLGNRFSYLHSLMRWIARSPILVAMLKKILPAYVPSFGLNIADTFRISNRRIVEKFPELRNGCSEQVVSYFEFNGK
jgi:hypothetical protein